MPFESAYWCYCSRASPVPVIFFRRGCPRRSCRKYLQHPMRRWYVRKPVEFRAAHIPGSKNIPLDEIEQRLDELRSDNGVLIYCINGARTRQAEPLLYSNGIDNVYHLEGALQTWISEQRPIEKCGVKKSW